MALCDGRRGSGQGGEEQTEAELGLADARRMRPAEKAGGAVLGNGGEADVNTRCVAWVE
jgi:hypothetical protein